MTSPRSSFLCHPSDLAAQRGLCHLRREGVKPLSIWYAQRLPCARWFFVGPCCGTHAYLLFPLHLSSQLKSKNLSHRFRTHRHGSTAATSCCRVTPAMIKRFWLENCARGGSSGDGGAAASLAAACSRGRGGEDRGVRQGYTWGQAGTRTGLNNPWSNA